MGGAAEAADRFALVAITSRDAHVLDLSTLRYDAPIARVWIFTLRPTGMAGTLPTGQAYSEARLLFEFDCAEDRRRLLHYAYYDEDGVVVVASREPDTSWDNVIPQTVSSASFDAACDRETKNIVLLPTIDHVRRAIEAVWASPAGRGDK